MIMEVRLLLIIEQSQYSSHAAVAHPGSLSCTVFSVFVLVEGQGEFVLPPEDNYNLVLDPYSAARSIFVFCFYNEAEANYRFRKDGVIIDIGIVPDHGVSVPVPNGDYTSSVEGTYTCSVTVNGQDRGSRDTIVRLPVLFSVDVTTLVVTVGETVMVNCSQTGYIRTQWSWRRNGTVVTDSSSERVYTEVSTRTKLGPSSTNNADNHQSLFLRLRYARMMDNGVYTCVTETDTQTVTVDVQPPANVWFRDGGPVSYEVPLPFESTTVSYADFLYSGSEDNGMLRGGVGQLVDGVKGTEALDTDKGRYAWVGWTTPLQEIIFEFGSLQRFGSVTVYAYFNSSSVVWFGTIEVAVSRDKAQWSTFSHETNNLHGPQDTVVPTQMDDSSNAEGIYVRLRFGDFQGSGPMLISEVSFDSTPVTPLCALSIGLLAGLILAIAALVVVAIFVYLATCYIMKRKRLSVMAQKGEGSGEDHSYPYNNPPTEMVKNPAYVAMEMDQDLGPQGDEGSVTEYNCASPDMERDTSQPVATLSDEDPLQSASYI